MAASVAHEVNNPLTTIKVLIHTLRDRTPADDPDREDLDVTLDEIDKIRALILRFLQFARPGEPEWSQVKVEDVARRVVNLVRPQATSRGITITEDWDEHSGGIRADGSQLGQVILNLLLNAVDAAPQGGELVVSTQAGTDGDIVLRVWNSGESLQPALAQKIFEPFYTTKAHGTGLGLAIASAIVEKHDGRIWARGLKAGGTEIKVALPRAPISE
jgi:signal transduction histidine kinase